jgi:hypothetical protein
MAPKAYYELLDQAVNNLDVKIRNIVNNIETSIDIGITIARQ